MSFKTYICNCSLAGTEACENCNNNPNIPNPTIIWPTPTIYSNPLDNNAIVKILKDNKKAPVIQYWCPDCDAILDKYQKFCHNCGLELDRDRLEDYN